MTTVAWQVPGSKHQFTYASLYLDHISWGRLPSSTFWTLTSANDHKHFSQLRPCPYNPTASLPASLPPRPRTGTGLLPTMVLAQQFSRLAALLALAQKISKGFLFKPLMILLSKFLLEFLGFAWVSFISWGPVAASPLSAVATTTTLTVSIPMS